MCRTTRRTRPLKSDLTNAKTAVIAYYADGNTAAATSTLLKPYGFVESVSGSVTIVASNTTGALCIKAKSESGASNFFYVTSTTAPSTTACTAAA